MTLWLTLNTVAILLLASVLFLTIRQLGVLLAQVGVVGARQMEDGFGPRIGENISVQLRSEFGLQPHQGESTLLLFGANSCPVCASVRDATLALSQHWKSTRFVIVYDAEGPDTGGALKKVADRVYFTYSSTLREALSVRTIPYAAVATPEGKVVSHGLVNNTSHLESLLEQLTGFHEVHADPRREVLSVSEEELVSR